MRSSTSWSASTSACSLLAALLVVLLGVPLRAAEPLEARDLVFLVTLSQQGGISAGGTSVSAPMTLNMGGIAVTSTDGLALVNPTAATAGVQVQQSPRLRFRGNAWDTAASETVDIWQEVLPVAGATPQGQLKWFSSINGGGAVNMAILDNGGSLTLANNVTIGAAASLSMTSAGFLGGNSSSGQFLLRNVAVTAGVGLDVATDSTLKVRTRAFGNGSTVDAGAFQTLGIPTTVSAAANFTSAANTNLQVITGLSWTFPANTAVKMHFDCYGTYSIATAVVAVDFGIQDVTVAPTNALFSGKQWIATGSAAPTIGTVDAFSSTTATSVTSATPGAITTHYPWELHGYIEQPSNASTSVFQIMIKTAAAADLPTVYRDSFCTVM